MCGISGVVVADPRLAEPAVRRMMAAMVHRGPDDEGFVELPFGADESGPVLGLGFRRLAILDLSPAGHQPMVNPSTGDWLVFNGEIYNFRALKAELSSSGVIFRGTSDTEVLLHALCRWQTDALPRLHGMFSLAFYHADTRRLLLARDPLGIKPLYVGTLPGGLAFASEVRALKASGIVPLDPDVAGIAGMLAYGAVQSPRTVFERIRSFPAGAFQWIEAGVASGRPPAPPRRFWSFPRPVAKFPRAIAAAEVRRLLRDSVKRHLVADVPVGVLLSAGIDSTAIAACAREHTNRLTAFTVGFGALTLDDEAGPAAQTAAALGIRHVAVQVDPSELPALWRTWVAEMDSPSIDGFNTRIVSRQVEQEGVVVGLSGLGSDELFGGYPTFSRAIRWARLSRGLQLVPRDVRSGILTRCGALTGRPGTFEKFADLAGTDGSVASAARALRRTLSDQRLAALDLAADKVGLADDFLDRPGPNRLEPAIDGDAFNTVSRLELAHYTADTLLRDTDANSMRHSLEIRVPFLDRPLVDYVSALPGSVKRPRGRPLKALLREAWRGELPEAVTRRRKTGFMLPIDSWMRNAVREECEAAIKVVEELPFLDGAEVRRLWQDFLEPGRSIHWSRPLALVVLGAHLGGHA
jgi:asparagine synthase (glutamine-hydrolysing)